MKKLFAMILAAMMILCSCAFAETTDNSLQAILDKGMRSQRLLLCC